MTDARIPILSVPIVEPDRDHPDRKPFYISREWRRFINDMWLRSGGSGDITGLFTTDIGVIILGDVVDDATPQLGGQLDVNGSGLGDGTLLILDFVEDAAAVNYIEIENEETGSGPAIRSVGSDTDVDLLINGQGEGNILFNGSDVICGDPGAEASGIIIGGVTYEAALKVSDLGGTNQAQFIVHRHSTTLPPVILASRSNSDDDTHSAVTDGQEVMALIGVGWDGTDYVQAAQIFFEVDGAPGSNDMPGRIVFNVTPDGGVAPAEAMRINNDKTVTLANGIVSVSDGDIAITPDGTGDIILDGQKWPQADGTNTQIQQTDGAGQLSWVDKPAGSGDALPIVDTTNIVKGSADATKQIRLEADTNITTGTTRVITMADQDIDLTPGSGSFIKDVVSDTTPQLGGDLDLNGKNIDFPTTANISDCLDEDDMSSDSATMLATQQSIKKYVDDNSGGVPILGTEQAASGTSVDFTSIPSGTKRIVVQLVGVSQDGATQDIIVQLGDVGGIETSGYLGAASNISTTVSTENMTAGLPVRSNVAAAGVMHGTLTLTLEDAAAFTWIATGVFAHSNGANMVVTAGSKSLSAELTQLRITTVGGSASFDAGAFNILYE